MQPTANVMAAAQRAYVFATEDPDYRRLAKAMEIDVVDAPEFVERYAKKSKGGKRRARRRRRVRTSRPRLGDD